MSYINCRILQRFPIQNKELNVASLTTGKNGEDLLKKNMSTWKLRKKQCTRRKNNNKKHWTIIYEICKCAQKIHFQLECFEFFFVIFCCALQRFVCYFFNPQKKCFETFCHITVKCYNYKSFFYLNGTFERFYLSANKQLTFLRFQEETTWKMKKKSKINTEYFAVCG